MKDWRDSREYRLWRVAVIRRDTRCRICGTIKQREAHHLDHAAYFPERRFLPKNGVTLCKGCHTHYHCDFHDSFRTKCTAADFNGNFMSLVAYLMGIVK